MEKADEVDVQTNQFGEEKVLDFFHKKIPNWSGFLIIS
jgi:hypothetical protein